MFLNTHDGSVATNAGEAAVVERRVRVGDFIEVVWRRVTRNEGKQGGVCRPVITDLNHVRHTADVNRINDGKDDGNEQIVNIVGERVTIFQASSQCDGYDIADSALRVRLRVQLDLLSVIAGKMHKSDFIADGDGAGGIAIGINENTNEIVLVGIVVFVVNVMADTVGRHQRYLVVAFADVH